MQLGQQRHLAYCTNVHRGETWAETFHALCTHTLAVKAAVCPPGEPYGIGLRLSDLASEELTADASLRDDFRRWLDLHGCYVFTINGFPYGQFHGTRVKEGVYAPDWTTPERLAYTCRLFDLLAEWLPAGVGGSVSTVPGGFKGFAAPGLTEREAQTAVMCRNLRLCGEHLLRLGDRHQRSFTLALEPEPCCWFENTPETLEFFTRLGSGLPIGLCFDTCHFAVEFENTRAALGTLTTAGVSIAKMHLSAALQVTSTPENLVALRAFRDPVYLHQTVARSAATGQLTRWLDLEAALADAETAGLAASGDEWRIHFHVPLHQPPAHNHELQESFPVHPQPTTDNRQPTTGFRPTLDAAVGALEWLADHPALCPHLEMETYTWEVLPAPWRAARVEEQISREYAWTLARLRERCLLA